jgi:hypothetical protein
LLLWGCNSGARSGKTDLSPDAIVIFKDSDSLECKILWTELLNLTVWSAEEDTLQIDLTTVEKILDNKTFVDITSQHFDRELVKYESTKRSAVAKRDKLRADVRAGLKKQAELKKSPMALLASAVDATPGSPPSLIITVMNLYHKNILSFKAKIYCFDEKGKPVKGGKKKQAFFEAVSRTPIAPEDEFTTALMLKNHLATRKVKVEIVSATFADKTAWKGKIEESKQ